MEQALAQFVDGCHWNVLLALIVGGIAVLSKGADWLVEEAVVISLRAKIPRMIVGATIVSMGTTMPEMIVSVLAAMKGEPGLALGNAVGSIICDTGLILGLCCLISPLPIHRQLVNRQGWIQIGAGVLLVMLTMDWRDPRSVFEDGSTLLQPSGWLLLALLVAYILWSIRHARHVGDSGDEDDLPDARRALPVCVFWLVVSLAMVLAASRLLIESATELAERVNVPESVVAATLVAFGTSLPELIICTTATLKKHGELAVGNVIGADILNVLFVAGASASVTPGGLKADSHFFQAQFPAMLFILAVFRVGVWRARGDRLGRPFGAVLLATYLIVTVASYMMSH